MRYTLFLSLILAACTASTPEDRPAMRTVNVYTHRHYDADKQLFATFTERTGIRVQVIQAGDDELMARMEAEGQRSPCDVFITADAGRLGLAKQRGLLQPVQSTVLQERIPAHLRDADDQWFGLTLRARVVAYDRNKVDPAELATYQDLTAPRWKGRLLVRSSENVYNQSLLAAIIAHDGPDAAEAWARGIVANLARAPKGGDTDQLLAIAEGIGEVAIVNSYYVGKVLAGNDPAQAKARAVLGVAFPSWGDHGTHVNVSGAGVARHAPDREAAIALIEFLSGPEAQQLFAEANMEYPVLHGVATAPVLRDLGTFKQDTLDLSALARYNTEAVKRAAAAGWK